LCQDAQWICGGDRSQRLGMSKAQEQLDEYCRLNSVDLRGRAPVRRCMLLLSNLICNAFWKNNHDAPGTEPYFERSNATAFHSRVSRTHVPSGHILDRATVDERATYCTAHQDAYARCNHSLTLFQKVYPFGIEEGVGGGDHFWGAGEVGRNNVLS
jgi:hypothetical protein